VQSGGQADRSPIAHPIKGDGAYLEVMDRRVFISGATGYVGARVTRELLSRNWAVTALARQGSERKLPPGCQVMIGNALNAATFRPSAAAYIHLVGTPHPAPWKGEQFRAVDLVSLKASLTAAVRAGVEHFIYMSVAHPAPVMKSYIEVRTECERCIRDAGLRATILRPWYVLGPGHYWPYAIKPVYALLERIPRTRESARRLGLVTIKQMTAAIVHAAENPPSEMRIVEVPEIRECELTKRDTSERGSFVRTMSAR